MPRPPKFDAKLVDTLYSIIDNHKLMALVMTDEDLLFKLNDFLDPGNRLSLRTFQRYKHYALHFGTDETPEDIDPMYGELYRAIRMAQQSQKLTLMNNLMDSKGSEWHKYKWIIERKFPDWNLSHINRRAEADAKEFEEMLREEKNETVAVAEPPRVPEKPKEKTYWEDPFGNILVDWNPDMTLREDELPCVEKDNQARMKRRYFEEFRGYTGDRPNYLDSNLKNYWPEGFAKPIVDEDNNWWSDKFNKPYRPEFSVQLHSIQKQERERMEADPNYQPLDFKHIESINPKNQSHSSQLNISLKKHLQMEHFTVEELKKHLLQMVKG